MRVAIHSVDGLGFPNLALMKIAAYHRNRGDDVSWFMPLGRYDRIYASKVFTFTPEDPYLPQDAIRGGTGYDVASRLPDEIEATKPDYTVYPQFSEAYGFLTRGCCNSCPWCVVPKKEGQITIYDDIENIAQGRKSVVLMDNNFLAAPLDFIRHQMEKARRLGLKIDFNQATDARRYTEQTARIMASVRYIKWVRLACDQDSMVQPVMNAVDLLRGYGYRGDIMCYVLARNDGIESALYRIAKLTEHDRRTYPFVMPYRSLTDNSIVPSQELKRLARWCNRPWIRKSCAFSAYKA